MLAKVKKAMKAEIRLGLLLFKVIDHYRTILGKKCDNPERLQTRSPGKLEEAMAPASSLAQRAVAEGAALEITIASACSHLALTIKCRLQVETKVVSA